METVKKEKQIVDENQRQEQEAELRELRNMPVSEGGMMVEAKPIIVEDQFPCHKVEEPAPLTEPVFSPSQLLVSLRAMR
jgi:hypothetical protein